MISSTGVIDSTGAWGCSHQICYSFSASASLLRIHSRLITISSSSRRSLKSVQCALLILAPVASTTAVFISITSDAGSKWNKNVITMPVSRNQIIREKFIFYILLAVIGLITALAPCIVLMLAGADITVHSLCLYAAIGMSATLLAGGISLPCAYLFDPEKSQIVFMMSFMASTGVIVGLVLLTNLFIPVKDNIQLAFNIVLVISVVWFFISYRIAVAVYKNRDIV